MAQATAFKLRKLSLRIALCSATGMAVLGSAVPALANPSGASVAHGSATFMQDGGLLQIENSPGAIIDWASFSIAQDEITRFQQQSAQSAVLNRVTGGELSELLGQLSSNGQVFLINPNGIVFGQNATIDTAGFVASTLDISNQDFLDGNYRFAGDSGRIVNQGYLTTRSGNVYFIAPDIENAGIIHAESGALILAAGRSIRIGSLDAPDIQFEITAPDDAIINLGQLLADQGSIHAFAGTLTHSGAISAGGAALAEDGSVILYAEGDIQLQAGSAISASGASGGDILVQSNTGTVLGAGAILADGANGDAGRIRLLGHQVGLLGQARVSAEGSGDGGEILIGGNVTGLGPEPNAEAVFIGTDTRVSASSTDSGDGGTIIAYADNLNRSYGTLTARGGPNGGDGGFIETSGGFIEVTRTPDAGASNGAPGQWLIDPDLLVIGEGDLVGVDGQFFDDLTIFTADPAPGSTIQNTLIETAINEGTSVWVQTTFDTAGSIRIVAPLSFNAVDSGLVLNFIVDAGPANNIFVEAPIINTGPASLEYGFIIGPGFVEFGADVDTGGAGDGLIIINSGDGATATFSDNVTLRGNLGSFFAGADIDGFVVVVDGDAFLGELTLQNDASLTVNGELIVSPSQGSGELVMSSANLVVTGEAEVGQAAIAESSFTAGGFLSVDGELSIDTSVVDVGGLAIFGPGSIAESDVNIGNNLFVDDTLNINGSNVEIVGFTDIIQGFISASTVTFGNTVFIDDGLDIGNLSTVNMNRAFVESLTLTNSTLQLFDALQANTIDVLDGILLGSETGANALSFNTSGLSEVFLSDLSVGDLNISGGTFDIDGTASTGTLTLDDNGALTGSGDVSITGIFDWTGGVLDGTGLLDIAPGGSLISTPGASLAIQDRTLRNRSDIGIDLVNVQLALNGTAVLDNQGRMRFDNTGGNFQSPDFSSGTGSILNAGSFESDGFVTISNRFDNSGIATVNSSNLRLVSGGIHSGSFLMTRGDAFAGLQLAGTHTLDATSTLEGQSLFVPSGTITINGVVDLDRISMFGNVILNSDADLDILTLAGTNPMLTGTGNITVADSFRWDGGTISGTGTVAVAATAQTDFGTATGTLRTVSGRTLTIADPDARLERGRLQIINGGVFENSGGFTFATEDGTPFTIEGGVEGGVEGGASGTFRNTGSVTATSDLILGTNTENSGTLQAPNLELAAGMTLDQSGGSITTPATFAVLGALTQQNGTLSAGTVEFPAGGSAMLSGTLTADSAAIRGGNLDVGDTASIGELGLSAGSLGGQGAINVSNRFDWNGGTIDGTGSLSLGSGSTGAIDGAGRILTGFTLNNAGTLALGSNLALRGGSTLRNTGTLDVAAPDGAGVTISGTATETLDNGGNLVASTPLTLGVRTVSSGAFSAPALTLMANTPMSITGGNTNVAGSFAVAGDLMLLGGTLAATTTNVTGSLGGVGTLTGNLNNSGTLSPGTSPGEFTIDGDFTQDELGTLIIELDGDLSQPGVDFDLLTITGSASFDGTLELIALEDFNGTFGESFEPITYASATGGFARVVQPSEGDQFTPLFGPNGLTAQQGLALNPDGTANIDTDDPPLPADQAEAELIADSIARSRGTTQEQIETTNTAVTLSDEQQLVEEECADQLDRPDATGDSIGQGVGCRSM